MRRTREFLKSSLERLLHVLPVSASRLLFEASRDALHNSGPDFVTTRTRPKSGTQSPYKVIDPLLPPTPGRVAVVVQGPLGLDDDFTVETVRYYTHHCPELAVIVSTWEGENAAALAAIQSLGAELVLNAKPTVPGRMNVNYQAVSTRGGLERARALGCAYAAKTRSDQRVYGLPMLLTLPRVLNAFPVRNAPGQRKRLLSTSRITSKYAPYFFSDLFMFGDAADLLAYWSMPPDDVSTGREELAAAQQAAPTLERAIAFSPEFYLLREYLRRHGGEPTFTAEAWLETIADRLCVIDWTTLDIYWPKYDPTDERADLSNDGSVIGHSLRFVDWLSLYFASPGTAEPREELLACPVPAPLPTRFVNTTAGMKPAEVS